MCMKNNKGFYLTDIIVKICIFLILINIGFIHITKQNEKKEIKEAKIIIYETFSTYRTKAFYEKQKYIIKLNYLEKKIYISKYNFKPIEILQLPNKLNYTTIFNRDKQDIFIATITENGNVTPSFSTYIFGYDNIAKYRISFYGFEIIKYLKINIYYNKGDKSASYRGIVKYHQSWNKDNLFWKEE